MAAATSDMGNPSMKDILSRTSSSRESKAAGSDRIASATPGLGCKAEIACFLGREAAGPFNGCFTFMAYSPPLDFSSDRLIYTGYLSAIGARHRLHTPDS